MIEIIPAIDIMDGKCVRLSQGNFAKVKKYDVDPVEVAKLFESAGLRRVHIVDLDGAKLGKLVNLKVLEAIALETDLKIDFGGGIRSFADLRSVFRAGATIANIGSIAFTDPELFHRILSGFSPKVIMLGADVRNGKIAVHGWQTETNIELDDFLRDYQAFGGKQVFVTDITRDGLLTGPSTQLYADIRRDFPNLKLIASGGVSCIDDVDALESVGCSGVILGKALYEGRIALDDLARRKSRAVSN